jgi:hypothetical protein
LTEFSIYPLAFLAGILFNLNPSCGSGSMVWASTQTERAKLIALAVIRIAVLSLVGVSAALLGESIRKPWGALMLITAGYLLYTTLRQARAKEFACSLPSQSKGLPWLMALVPPPSGFIGLALFYGGFNAPSPLQGALTLGLVGLGLTTPLWLLLAFPNWQVKWQNALMQTPSMHRTRLIFQFLGVGIFTLVGLAFLLIQDFHRPLLEIIQK